jgi:hypothetical protein
MQALRRHLHAFALALFVALLQAGLPVLAYAKMAKDNGLVQDICTPSGAKRVVVGQNGATHDASFEAGHDGHCQLCTGAGPAPLAALILMHESARNPAGVRIGQTCFQTGATVKRPPATGPPSGS